MKQAKQRVVAIDFFRGICLLVVLISHSFFFSRPFGYLSGHNLLWISAAELFFFLSGVTFVLIRKPLLDTDFRQAVSKSLSRAGKIYLLNFILVIYAVTIGYYLMSHNLHYYGTESLPRQSGLNLLIDTLLLRTTAGWADFLMYFSVFIAAAPFLYKTMSRVFWPAIIVLSYAVYLMHDKFMPYAGFAIWQLYFIAGICAAMKMGPVLAGVRSKSARFQKGLTVSLSVSAAALMAISILTAFPSIYRPVAYLTLHGWLPGKLQGAYYHLLANKSLLDHWFNYARTGTLRPLFVGLFISAAILIYDRHEVTILKYSGRLVTAFGRNSINVYTAQAIVIPLIAAIPVKFGNLVPDTLAFTGFILLMWQAANKDSLKIGIYAYAQDIKASFNQGRYAYYQQYEDG